MSKNDTFLNKSKYNDTQTPYIFKLIMRHYTLTISILKAFSSLIIWSDNFTQKCSLLFKIRIYIKVFIQSPFQYNNNYVMFQHIYIFLLILLLLLKTTRNRTERL